MQIVPAGQSNRLTLDLVLPAGTDLTTGTVTVYLRCLSGANAGAWWSAALSAWSASPAAAGTATWVRSAQWEISLGSAVWTTGVRYRLSGDHSGGSDIGASDEVFCSGAFYEAAAGGDSLVSLAEARGVLKRTEADDANLLIMLLAAEEFAAAHCGITLDSEYIAAHPGPWRAIKVAVIALAGNWLENPEASITGTTIAEVPLGALRILDQVRGVVI